MSLEDESFPHDSLFALDLSPAPLGRFPFPRRSLEQRREQSFSGESNKSSLLLVHNISTSSAIGDQTISSADSVSEQPPLAIVEEEHMVESDQTGTSSTTISTVLPNPQTFSLNNIHSEYTKRRYKHIESKVGQYIANIRNEDERRKRKQFQRHNSLPEITVQDTTQVVKKPMGLQRSATIVAEHLNRALVGVIENGDENDEEDDGDDADVEVRNSTATTSGTISTHGSSSGRGSAVTDEHQPESDESAEGVGSAEDDKCAADNCIDTKTLALLLDERDRLQSYIDYQQTKLDEKQSEITRLRKNVDFLRVRLSTTEDQLKRSNTSGRSMTLTSSGTHGGVFGAGYGQGSVGNWGAGRQSLQGLLYCVAKNSQATQTEMLQLTPTPVHPPTPPPPPPPSPLPLDLGLPRKEAAPLLYVTPDTPDGNNNNNAGADGAVEAGARNVKTVATIQPMSLNFSNYLDGDSAERRATTKDCATLRRRSNSLASRQQQQQRRAQANSTAARSDKSDHNSRSSHPSSSDSAIDVEVIDLSTSPKPSRRKRYNIERTAFGTYAPKAPRNFTAYNRDQSSPSPMGLYIAHCPNSTALDISTSDEAQSARQLLPKPVTTGGGGGGAGGVERRATKRSLSRRWLHLFGSCIRCTNPQRGENEQFPLQQTYTQVPLLESTFERSCMELRSQ